MLEPVSPALAGGFLTTAPPGKPTVMRFVFKLLYFAVLNYLNLLLILYFFVDIFYFCISLNHVHDSLLQHFYDFYVVLRVFSIFWVLDPFQIYILQIPPCSLSFHS